MHVCCVFFTVSNCCIVFTFTSIYVIDCRIIARCVQVINQLAYTCRPASSFQFPVFALLAFWTTVNCFLLWPQLHSLIETLWLHFFFSFSCDSYCIIPLSSQQYCTHSVCLVCTCLLGLILAIVCMFHPVLVSFPLMCKPVGFHCIQIKLIEIGMF